MDIQQQMQAADEVLVDDLLLDVFSFLNARDLHIAAAPVCKRWYDVVLVSSVSMQRDSNCLRGFCR